MNEKTLEERYLDISLKFINSRPDKKDILCVFLTGSYFNKCLRKNSDLDMFIVTKPGPYREKGIKLIEGVKIGYFLNPLNKVDSLIFLENKELKRPTCEMIYFSRLIYGSSIEGNRLKKSAKACLLSKLPLLSKKEITYLGWKLSDKISTIKRMDAEQLTLDREYASHDLFHHTLTTFFRYNRRYIPNTKYVLAGIKKLDAFFYSMVKKYLNSNKKEDLISLSDYLVGVLKFRHKEYKERSAALIP